LQWTWGDVTVFTQLCFLLLSGPSWDVHLVVHRCNVGYARQLHSLLAITPSSYAKDIKNQNEFDIMVCGCKFVLLKAKQRNVLVVVMTWNILK
jgi:hypothetical protein